MVPLVALLTVLGFAMPARAQTRSIAVLQPDGELFRAISLGLSPWGIRTIRSDAPIPARSQPEAVEVASRLARQLEVEALVWVTSLGQGSLLWVFDVGTGDVTTRLLPETPPFDSAAAAAVALSVKTVLRTSVVAPPDERFGAQAATPTFEPIMAVEAGAGAHWLGEEQVDIRGRFVGVLWFPALRRLGLSVEASLGPGARVEHAAYNGRYRELTLGAKLRLRALNLPSFTAFVALGGAAHWATLSGTLLADARGSSVERLNGSVDLEAAVAVRLWSRIYLGASAGAAYFPTYRRYLVNGEPVFAPWPLTTSLSGYCGAELF